MTPELSPAAQRVQAALQALDLDCQVVELPASTRTAPEAAAAVGCTVGQIVKSLIFRGKESGRAVLSLVSGANRVNEQILTGLLGEPVGKADADFVREQTGFAIGGVAPLAHAHPILTFIDEDLLQYEEIWAAAGTPNAVFRLKSADLQRMTGGQVVKVK
jgi:prolyl-tRNA editing enzyme YbaK/EbsC (Cys-tRNA(Pro) deacylase)